MHYSWQEMKTAKGRRKILKHFGIKIIAEESDYWRVTGDKQEMGNVASLYAIEFNYDSDRCKPGVWIMTWDLSGVKMCGAPDLSWKCWVED
jgi:predicted NUDIX family NTP pyrophosphohydrolase